MRKQILIPLLTLLLLLIATAVVVLYGQGYRLGLNGGRLDVAGTGLLVTTSVPDGAQVFVNDHLTTATDNTINLPPNEYKVKIVKEGYFPWEKTIVVKKEVVAKAEALLLPIAPKLENLTSTGVQNPSIDPSLTKIAYVVASQSAIKKRGIYVLDMNSRPILTLQSSATQIADDTLANLSLSTLNWSPDGAEIMANIASQSSYLLNSRGYNSNPQDVTETIGIVQDGWNKLQEEKNKAQLSALPSKIRKLITEHFEVLSWSLDESKVLYKAKGTSDLPIIITPRLIGANSTEEDRELKKGVVYVYDLKEDRNYKILDEENPKEMLTWFPDSKHLLFVHNKKIDLMEYDGKNQTTVYAGPFVDNFVFPWPDGSKIVILTDLGNPTIAPNLYTVVLK